MASRASLTSLATNAMLSNLRAEFAIMRPPWWHGNEPAARPRRRLAQLLENDKPVLIYSTFPSAGDAERVGAALVERGLAACVNIFPQMTAIYVWEGQRQRDSEA